MTIPTEKNPNDAFAYLLSSSDENSKLMRTAVLSDFQVGLPEKPSELQLTGRISYSTAFAEVQPSQIVYFPPDVTIFLVSILPFEILRTGVAYSQLENFKQTITVVLPQDPRVGQVCYVKDASGTAHVCAIKVQGSKIDGDDSKLLDYKDGCIGFIWSGAAWSTLSDGNQRSSDDNLLNKTIQAAIESYGPATTDPAYIVLTSSPSLPNERVLTAGSGITITDGGAGGSLTITAAGGGSGDVVGPASATDNAIARFDLTTGKLIQNSGVTIDDSNNVTVAGRIIVTGGTTSLTDATLGNAAVGSFPYYDGGGNSAVYAMFGHKDLDHSSVATNYALYQDNTGNTSINASTGKNLYFAINNVAMGAITNDIGSGVDAILFTGDLSTRTDITLGNTTGISETTIYAGTGDLNIGHNAAARTVNLGTGNNTTEQEVTVGSTFGRSPLVLRAGTGFMYLTGAVSTNFIIGHTAGTGDITVGRSTVSNTINIGNANTATTKTQTINIGAGTPAGTGKATVTVGNAGGASATNIYAGTGGIILSGSATTTITGSTSGQADAYIGTVEIGELPATKTSFPAVYAMFGHKALDHSADGNYALVQSNVGDTFLGAASTKAVVFKNGTSIVGYLDDNEISLTGKPSTAQDVTLGSTYGGSSLTLDAGTGSINIGTAQFSRTTTIGPISTNSPSAITHTVNIGYIPTHASAITNVNIGTAGVGGTKNVITIGNYDSTVDSTTTIHGDTISIGAAGSGAQTIGIGTSASIRTTNIATGAAAQTVTLGSTSGTSSLTLDAGTGNINIGTSDASRTINIGSLGNTALSTIKIAPGVTQAGQLEIALSSSFYNSVRIADGGSSTGHEVYINTGNNGTISNPISTASPTGYAVTKIGTLNDESRVTIGSTSGTSYTTINAGTGGITLSGSATTVITGSSTTNAEAYIGLAEIGELPWSKSTFPGVFAMFGHKTLVHTGLNYGLVQSNVGDTFLNAASGKSVFIANNGSAIAQIDTSVTSFTGSLTATITGNSTTVSGSNSLTLMSRVNGGRLLLSGSSILMTGSIGINLPGRTPVIGSGIHIKQQKDPTTVGTTITDNSAALRIEDADGDGWVIGAGNNNNLWFGWDYSSVGGGGTSTAQGYIRYNTNAFTLMNFTGQHRCVPHAGVVADFSEKIGLIVITSGDYLNPISGSTTGSYNRNIGINDATPTVLLASSRNDKRAFGIVSEIEDVSDGAREFAVGKFVSVTESGGAEDNRLFINAIGEGAIWVCNINGNLENGDYVTTCEIPGYGMKQDDDLLHNYTVAKITCNCDFSLNNNLYQCEEFIHEGVTYRRAFVGCTYHCG